MERPPYPPLSTVGGPHVCSGASCYVWENFSAHMQMYDGCCSVRWRLKRSPENWGPIVGVRSGAHLGLHRHWERFIVIEWLAYRTRARGRRRWLARIGSSWWRCACSCCERSRCTSSSCRERRSSVPASIQRSETLLPRCSGVSVPGTSSGTVH